MICLLVMLMQNVSMMVWHDMTNDEFKSWITGFLTLSDEYETLHAHAVRIIRNHAALVQAVMGNLDESVSKFVLLLEMRIQQQKLISLAELKDMAKFT